MGYTRVSLGKPLHKILCNLALCAPTLDRVIPIVLEFYTWFLPPSRVLMVRDWRLVEGKIVKHPVKVISA